jgi:CHAT domain-containing protein
MKVVALLCIVITTTARAQPAADQIRSAAAHPDGQRLIASVRSHPDDARELVRRLLVTVAFSKPTDADSALELARRVGTSYAAAWSDSFPLAQVTRFARLGAASRLARVRVDSLRWTANALYRRAGVDAAMPHWRAALSRARALNDTVSVAASLGNLGAGYYTRADLDSALVYLDSARTLAEIVGDRRTAANAIGTIGTIAMAQGDNARAVDLYTRSLALRSRIGDVRGAAADHNNLGLIAADLGDLSEARAHYREALSLARAHHIDEAAAAALTNLGNAASTEGQYADAVSRYAEALAIYRSSAADPDAALVLHNMGLLALRRGDYAASRARLREALSLFERVGTAEDLVQLHRDLASVAAAMGNLDGALVELRRAEQELAQADAQPALSAAIALTRADLAIHLNTYVEAERQFVRAEVLYRRAGDAVGHAEAQQGRAMLLVQQRQYARALDLLQAAARTLAATPDRRPAALANLMLGHARQRQGDVIGARHAYQQALHTLGALGDVVGMAAAYGALGDLELEARLPLAAEALFREGLAKLATRPAASVSWQLQAGLGAALQMRGALAEAVTAFRAAVTDIERVGATLTLEERRSTYFGDKWDVYAQLVIVERARGDAAAAFAVSERMRSRQMLDLLSRGRVASRASTDTTRGAVEQDLRRRIGDLTDRLEAEATATMQTRGRAVTGGAATAGVTREALARAQEQYAQLLLELREDDASHAPVVRGRTVTWREVARGLVRGEALVEYLVSDSTTLAFVVTPDTLRVLDLNIGRDALAPLVGFARAMLVRPSASSASHAPWRAPLGHLHQTLIAPLEREGALAGVSRLVIVPHAELHYLPFAALVGRSAVGTDEYLIERYEISYAPSASLWLRLGDRRSTRGRGVLALAPRTATLPGSRAEVQAIQELYGSQATVLTDARATEAAFRASAPKYSVVHLATYGVLNKHNPLFSFVQLGAGRDTDGRLEVHEIFGLTLRARLLVLSACQTALASGAISDVPAGDDWVGMVQAFLGIGAENVIATLWPVEDRSTAQLMTQLHTRLRAGDSESVALARAQRAMLRNPATAGPFYWAGFILVGGR